MLQAVQYVKEVERITRSNWHPPRSNDSSVVTLHIWIKKDGSINKLEVDKSSGNAELDAAAVAAAKASKYPPHQFGKENQTLAVSLSLAYTPMNDYALGDDTFSELKDKDAVDLITKAVTDLKDSKSSDAAFKTNKALNLMGADGLNHSYGIMTMIIQYFALMQGGKKAEAQKVLLAGKKFCPPDLWPAPAFRYVSSEISEAQFFEKAKTTRQKTHANWIAGTQKLLAANLKGAYANFDWIETNDPDQHLAYLRFAANFTRISPDVAKELLPSTGKAPTEKPQNKSSER